MTKILRHSSRLLMLVLIILSSSIARAQSSNETEGCAPLVVQFTAPGSSSSYYWDFDDGGTSQVANPAHTFTQVKNHTVKFKESQNGAVIGTIVITIYPKPKPSFTSDPSGGCAPLLVNFSNTSEVAAGITVTNYSWVFGDGTGGNGNANPTHKYINTGEYTVGMQLQTDKAGCDTTIAIANYIKTTNPPTPSFVTNPSPPVACAPPLNVSFTNTTAPGAYTFTWDFGAGETYTGTNPPAKNYTTTGTFPVSLILSDDVGCTKQTGISVGIGTPSPTFTLPNDTLCVGQIYKATNTSPAGTYQWEFGPDATPSTSVQISPNFRFNTGGTKTIKLTATSPDGQCTGSTTMTVFVEDVTASVTVDPTYSCSEPVTLKYTGTSTAPVTWEYLFEDGTTSNDQNPTYLYVDQDTTTHSLEGFHKVLTKVTITTAAGCKSTSTVETDVNTPNALFIPDVVDGCAPLTVEFNDTSYSNEPIAHWIWDFGDGNTLDNTTADDPTHTYNTPGEYPVRLIIINDGGCRDTSYVQTIYVGGPIGLDFTVDKTDICPGDVVQFTNTSNDDKIDDYHYYSDGDRLSHCGKEANPSWTFHDVGQHDVKMEVIYNGCHSELNKANLITVHGPIAKAQYEMDCAQPFEYQFSNLIADSDSLYWDFGDGQDTAIVAGSVTHTYAATGDYTVILKAINTTSGCPESLDTIEVFVRDIKADFTIPAQVCKGVDLMLDASSSRDVNGFCNTNYQWNSSERRPITVGEPKLPFEFSFGQSGDQWVELIVDDVNGCRDTLKQFTRVFGAEATVLPTDTLICLPNDVAFTTTSAGDTTLASWEWDFGDGSTGTGTSITHTFHKPGNFFSVTFKVKDVLGCEGTATSTINVYQPTSTIATVPVPANICAGETVSFTASDFTQQGSHLDFSWDFGNSTTGTGSTGMATYTSGGSYPVVLSFTEVATGCQGTTTSTVNVQDYPIADFKTSEDGHTVLCYPINIQFIDQSVPSSNLSQYWDFGNGGNAVGDTVFTVFQKGNFDITHIVTSTFGCSDTIVKPISTTGPEGSFTLDKTTICLGEDITATVNAADTVDVGSFYFDFGDGTLVHDSLQATHAYTFLPGSNQQPIKLILTSVDGVCSYTAEQIVNILNTKAEFTNSSGNLTGCEQAEFVFVNQSIDANQFEWDFGDGSGTSNLQNPTHTYTGAGTYTVTLSVSSSATNCTDMITHDVIILPEVPISADDVSMCQGDTAVLNVNSPIATYIYTWTPDTYLGTPNNSTTTAFPPATTDFVVTADDGHGCVGTDTVTLFVVVPLPDINFDTTIFAGTTIQLPVEYQAPYTFSWNPETGLSCLVCSNPSVTPTEDIVYSLNIGNDAGCANSTGTFMIHIFPEEIQIPNAFTPNGDGNNDFFNIIATDDVAALMDVTSFRVYSRWGQKVYDNEHPDRGWDGKFKGKAMPSDAYPFVVEVTFLNGKKKTIKGTVTLIR